MNHYASFIISIILPIPNWSKFDIMITTIPSGPSVFFISRTTKLSPVLNISFPTILFLNYRFHSFHRGRVLRRIHSISEVFIFFYSQRSFHSCWGARLFFFPAISFIILCITIVLATLITSIYAQFFLIHASFFACAFYLEYLYFRISYWLFSSWRESHLPFTFFSLFDCDLFPRRE